MKVKLRNAEQKHFFIKSYTLLSELRKAVMMIQESALSPNVSILGKFTNEQSFKNEKEQIEFEKQLKNYWKESLGSMIEFGAFKNPELGTVFIIGALTPMFLHKINGKALGGMSAGFYGILRGLGAYKLQADIYLKALNKGNYLLIVRGYNDELSVIDELLEGGIIY